MNQLKAKNRKYYKQTTTKEQKNHPIGEKSKKSRFLIFSLIYSIRVKKMKYEIANELGVNLGPDATSRANGSVGGEITRRLVQNGLNQVSGSYNNK